MAFSLNKIMLIGNLGRDAETRFTTNNLSVTNFSIATTRSFKDKDGNWQNETTWHNVTGFNLSDYYKDNLKKGKKFYIEAGSDRCVRCHLRATPVPCRTRPRVPDCERCFFARSI